MMQKWEYMVVIFEMTAQNEMKPRYIHETEVPNWQAEGGLPKFLAVAGENGYELVTMTDLFGSSPQQREAIFKRPKGT